MPPKPEELAREVIDGLLEQAGWLVQDARKANIMAGRGVAIREYTLKTATVTPTTSSTSTTRPSASSKQSRRGLR